MWDSRTFSGTSCPPADLRRVVVGRGRPLGARGRDRIERAAPLVVVALRHLTLQGEELAALGHLHEDTVRTECAELVRDRAIRAAAASCCRRHQVTLPRGRGRSLPGRESTSSRSFGSQIGLAQYAPRTSASEANELRFARIAQATVARGQVPAPGPYQALPGHWETRAIRDRGCLQGRSAAGAPQCRAHRRANSARAAWRASARISCSCAISPWRMITRPSQTTLSTTSPFAL